MNFKPEDFENVGAWNSGGGIVLEVATHKATGLGIGLTSDCLVVYELTEDGDFEKPLFEIQGDGSRWWESPWSDLVAELAEAVCEDICDAWAVDVDGTIGEVNPTTALRYTYAGNTRRFRKSENLNRWQIEKRLKEEIDAAKAHRENKK